MNRDRLWNLIWGVAVLGVILLGTLLGVVPKIEEANAAVRDSTAIETQNAAYELKLASLKDDFAQIDELKADLAELQLGIPLGTDYPAFVAQLAAVADQYGITIDQIAISDGTGYAAVPVAEVTDAAAADPSAATAAADAVPAAAEAVGTETGLAPSERVSSTNYVSIPVSIEARGNATSVLDFISGMQHGNRIMAVTTLTTDATTADGVVTVEIAGEIYVLADPSV